MGAFRDVRTEKAGVFTIRAYQTEKRDAFRADRTKTVDTSMIYYENQVRGILERTTKRCLERHFKEQNTKFLYKVVAFRAHGFEKEGSFRADEVKKKRGGFGDGGHIPILSYYGSTPTGSVTAKLISAFVFATRTVQSLFFLNPKFQASSYIFFDCTAQFVSDLFENHIVGLLTRRLI